MKLIIINFFHPPDTSSVYVQMFPKSDQGLGITHGNSRTLKRNATDNTVLEQGPRSSGLCNRALLQVFTNASVCPGDVDDMILRNFGNHTQGYMVASSTRPYPRLHHLGYSVQEILL
jgi:hypothetical protein